MSHHTRLFALLLVAALVAGAAITWVDTRPGWDDTGISVGLVLLSAGLLGLAQPAGWWAWALAVGAWIPLIEIPPSGNWAALLALAVALVGAVGGALVRQALNALRGPSTPPPA